MKLTSQQASREEIEADRHNYSAILRDSLAMRMRHDWPSRVAVTSASPISRGSVGFEAEDLHNLYSVTAEMAQIISQM